MSNKKEQYKNELKTANSLQDIFNITQKYYSTDDKLGIITKQVILVNIDKLIIASNIKLKP